MLLNFNLYTPSEKVLKDKICSFDWDALLALWQQIKDGNTPDWDKGKALEYMFVRAFDLENAEVAYPYSNGIINSKEQIDGYVFMPDLGVGFIVECKDWSSPVSFDEIAKLHGRISYRLPSTYGIFVSKKGYTPSATELLYLMNPHKVLLWSFNDIDECFKNKHFAKALKYKYQYAMMTADPDIAVIEGLNI